jgi:hypothetical protein
MASYNALRRLTTLRSATIPRALGPYEQASFSIQLPGSSQGPTHNHALSRRGIESVPNDRIARDKVSKIRHGANPL